ncbi:hypothetical protein [Cryobacterium arcticum]|uniref:Uncharacterized protein n=1 Tax=Cryobacterium arcticum TaxID=670052 RepID=A0A1B1BLH9_9MICO|nr:hypothetical protein [Cryobacterium arcticum]ANP73507.1 hypothetical protein PA27867_2563 [Cryobacterium arcticum]
MTNNDVRSSPCPSTHSRAGRLALAATLSVALVGTGALGLAPASAVTSTASTPASGVPAADASAPLTNLSHLNFLLDEVPLPVIDGHTTYQAAENPVVEAPWTYADKNDDGSYTPIGGGDLDPVTGYYTQGAFNADDTARAAVVYLRHWQQTGDTSSRDHAFQTLRSLTYLQTTEGPNAGNVVLWQQIDGTLNPSAEPVELPDPSDSAESYWLARTVWALGEGYAAFADEDPAFAAFLQDRLTLSLAALNAGSLGDYPSYDVADGDQVPGWLIADGADASAEAVLGLAAYVQAGPTGPTADTAETALAQLSEGIAAMSTVEGASGDWPFGAIMPWTHSPSLWHAWGGMAPAAVAVASEVLDDPALLTAAVQDTAQFTPQLLAAGGPDNAWSPTPGEAQIAYGVDSRLQSLVATADVADAPGLLNVAAITAGWYFGANRSGQPAYDPATGTAIDGIERDGRVNTNSGAESTIHALLSMITLDAHPDLKAAALGVTSTVATHGLSVVEAESGSITGGTVVTPESSWTGEANWSGGAYVDLAAGGTLRITVPADDQARRVHPIVNQVVDPSGTTTWTTGTGKPGKGPGKSGTGKPGHGAVTLGTTANGGAGEQGVTEAPGQLLPLPLTSTLPGKATQVIGTTDAAAQLDALLIQPLISTVAVTGPAGDSALFVSADTADAQRRIDVPRGQQLVQEAFDATGQPVADSHKGKGDARSGKVFIAAGGFTQVWFEAKK